MFSDIAPRYDLLNHLLTLNIDRRWRRRAVDRLLEAAPRESSRTGRFLDACAGTLDLARELADRDGFEGHVVASDFAHPMLERGRAKVVGMPVAPTCSDALQLPVRDDAFDGAIVGFGVRNFADLDAGLRELRRAIRRDGPLVILELSLPARQPFRGLYMLYFTRILPWIGRRVSGHDTAYAYLPASVRPFPTPAGLEDRLREAGFHGVRHELLLGGMAAIHVGLA